MHHEPRIVDSLEWERAPMDYATARALVVAAARPGGAQSVPLVEALHRVLAVDVVAAIDVPPFDNAAMDGYAVTAANVSTGRTVSAAAIDHISTGMPLPPHTDAIVPWEHTTTVGNEVTFTQDMTVGQYVRSRGHDIAKGRCLVTKGTALRPAHLGALAAVGMATASVVPPPRVGLLISGGELSRPDDAPADGQVYDINSSLLPALLRDMDAEVHTVLRCGDSEAETLEAYQTLAANADVIVTTGGASVGERDWVRTTLETHGTLDVWKVAVRPGKPFGFGSFAGTPVLMLPGNPGSVLACTHAFVAPFLRVSSGRSPEPATQKARLSARVDNAEPRTFVCPVQLTGSDATPLLAQSSQGIAHASTVDGFVILPPSARCSAGDEVLVELA